MSSLPSAVFLDRDGTIIKDVKYISQPEEVELIDDAIDLALLILDRGGAGDLGIDHRRRRIGRRADLLRLAHARAARRQVDLVDCHN